jgi:hypothetical protein
LIAKRSVANLGAGFGMTLQPEEWGAIPKNGFGEAIEAEELRTFLVQPFVLMPQIGVRHRTGAFFF